MKKTPVQTLVFTGLMVAIGIILSQLVSITLPNPSSPIIKFGIGYLPLMIVSIIYGPVFGFFAAVSQDLLGFFLIGGPQGQYFHLGFTLNAVLYGIVPSLFFHFRRKLTNHWFYIFNFALALLFFLIVLSYLFNIDLVHSSTLDTTQKYILASVSLFATVVLILFNFLMKKQKKYEFNPHKILFVVMLLYMLVSLILTPIWLFTMMNPDIAIWHLDAEALVAYVIFLLPLRIVKMPIEVIAYVLLLTPLLNLVKKLVEHREFEEIDS
jgi:ECF transporter S component (folate family)